METMAGKASWGWRGPRAIIYEPGEGAGGRALGLWYFWACFWRNGFVRTLPPFSHSLC